MLPTSESYSKLWQIRLPEQLLLQHCGQLNILWQSTWEYSVTGLGHRFNVAHHPPILKAEALCDSKALYGADDPPILILQKADLLKITESQKLNQFQIFNLPTSHRYLMSRILQYRWQCMIVYIWRKCINMDRGTSPWSEQKKKRAHFPPNTRACRRRSPRARTKCFSIRRWVFLNCLFLDEAPKGSP